MTSPESEPESEPGPEPTPEERRQVEDMCRRIKESLAHLAGRELRFDADPVDVAAEIERAMHGLFSTIEFPDPAIRMEADDDQPDPNFLRIRIAVEKTWLMKQPPTVRSAIMSSMGIADDRQVCEHLQFIRGYMPLVRGDWAFCQCCGEFLSEDGPEIGVCLACRGPSFDIQLGQG